MNFIKKEEKQLEDLVKKPLNVVNGLEDKLKPSSSPKKSSGNSITNEAEKIASGIDKISDPFDTKNRKPLFSLFGFSDLSVIDFWAGFWTGVFGRDVRDEWHQCLISPLHSVKEITDVSIEFIT